MRYEMCKHAGDELQLARNAATTRLPRPNFAYFLSHPDDSMPPAVCITSSECKEPLSPHRHPFDAIPRASQVASLDRSSERMTTATTRNGRTAIQSVSSDLD